MTAENPEAFIQLWRVDSKRCLISHPASPPPFVVDLYEGGDVLAHYEFADHDAATINAIDALHKVAKPA